MSFLPGYYVFVERLSFLKKKLWKEGHFYVYKVTNILYIAQIMNTCIFRKCFIPGCMQGKFMLLSFGYNQYSKYNDTLNNHNNISLTLLLR